MISLASAAWSSLIEHLTTEFGVFATQEIGHLIVIEGTEPRNLKLKLFRTFYTHKFPSGAAFDDANDSFLSGPPHMSL